MEPENQDEKIPYEKPLIIEELKFEDFIENTNLKIHAYNLY